MPVYEVIGGLDVWGNAVDGYEINNQHPEGFATLRDEWDERRIIETLSKQGHLGNNAVELLDAGELGVETEGIYEDGLGGFGIVEREQAWAHYAPGEEPRFIDAHDDQTAEQVAEDDGESPEEYELVEGWRPILLLHAQIPEHEERKRVFWRDSVLSGDAQRPGPRVKANVELRIDPEAPGRSGKLLVDVWVDGEFFGERPFPFRDGYELGLAAHGGADPEKYQPLVEVPDAKEMEVALDAFWDNGGEAARRYLKVKPYSEIVQGRKDHYPVLLGLAYRDGVDDGSVNWDHEYTADDIVAIRADARAWAEHQVEAGDVGDVGFMADVRTDYPELSEPQFEAVQRRYREGVITGLTSSALAYSALHGDALLAAESEPHQIRDDRGLLFIAVPRGTPPTSFNRVGRAYVLELDDNVLDSDGGAVTHWHEAGIEDWAELGVDVDLAEPLGPEHFILPSRGVMTDSRGEFDVYELQDIEIA